MSDVRLTATNPADSSVVPVACNERGELMTVAPVIEVIPNDVEVQGNLTVTGEYIGLPDVDSGLPEGGEEGQVLSIMNGEPTWVFFEPPEPPPPANGVTLVDNYGATNNTFKNYGLRNNDGSLSSQVSSWDATLRTLDCWESSGSQERGLACNQKSSGNQSEVRMPFQLDLKGGAGMVLELHCATKIGQNNPPQGTAVFEISTTTENLIGINTRVTHSDFVWTKGQVFTFLVNRPDLGVCDFELKGTAPSNGLIYSVNYLSLQRYELVDASTYIRRLLKRAALAQVLLP